MTGWAPRPLSRRAFLAGTAGIGLLAACGGNGDGDTGSPTTAGQSATPQTQASLVNFFGDDFLVPGIEQRATFGLGDAEGVVSADVPPGLTFTVRNDEAGFEFVAAVDSHGQDIPRPYFPLVFTPPEPGFYTAEIDLDGQVIESTFGVVETVAIPQVGNPMPAVDTPTVSDPHRVNPICTDDPQCPLHEVTLSQALTEGRPVALLISTPKFCQVAICGPVLDVLLAQQQSFSGIRMIHAEVYTDETTQTVTPAINAFGLTYEPSLFVASSDGLVAARLDNIFDTVELETTLRAVS